MLTACKYFIKHDLIRTKNLLRFALVKAAIRLQLQFNKTIVGLLWEPLSLLIVTLALSAIWSLVLVETNFIDFFYFILSGMLVWNVISAIVIRGVNVFYFHITTLRSRYVPLSLLVLEDLFYEIYRFVLPFLLFLPLFMLKSDNVLGIFWFIYGIFLIVVSSFGFIFLFGSLSFFYQDVKQVIHSIMRLAFLLTPIIWRKERLGDYENFVFFNPFYPYIEICRNGILGQPIDIRAIVAGTLLTIIIFISGLLFVSMNEKRIRYAGFQS